MNNSGLRLYIIYALPGVFEYNPYPNAVNGSLWTLPVEIFLYILVWFIYVITKKEKNRKILFGFVSTSMIVAFLIRIHFFPNVSVVVYGTDWIQALNVAPYFMIGGCAYLYNFRKYVNLQASSILLLVFGGISFAVWAINEIVCLLVLSYFVISIILSEIQGIKLKIINSEYAYGMYLYGFVVQQCVVQKLYVEMGVRAFIFPLSLVCTYFIAMLSNKVVYKPISRIIKKAVVKIDR